MAVVEERTRGQRQMGQSRVEEEDSWEAAEAAEGEGGREDMLMMMCRQRGACPQQRNGTTARSLLKSMYPQQRHVFAQKYSIVVIKSRQFWLASKDLILPLYHKHKAVGTKRGQEAQQEGRRHKQKA